MQTRPQTDDSHLPDDLIASARECERQADDLE